jgi:hypothetical protein
VDLDPVLLQEVVGVEVHQLNSELYAKMLLQQRKQKMNIMGTVVKKGRGGGYEHFVESR